MMGFRRLIRGLAFVLIMSSGACQAWHVEKRPVEAVIRDHPSGPVAVTMTDLRWVVLQNPRIVNDSITGVRRGGNTHGGRSATLDLRGVRSVETRRFSFLRTFYLLAAAAFVPTLYRLAVVEED